MERKDLRPHFKDKINSEIDQFIKLARQDITTYN